MLVLQEGMAVSSEGGRELALLSCCGLGLREGGREEGRGPPRAPAFRAAVSRVTIPPHIKTTTRPTAA